jgi:hypothetical protein
LNETLATAKPTVTALLGELALNVVGGRERIGSWRGSVFVQNGKKYVATMHPAVIFTEPRMRAGIRQDFVRIAREAVKPEMMVKYEDKFQFCVSASRFVKTLKDLSGRQVALDIETSYGKAIDVRLNTIGIAWSAEEAMNVNFGALSTEEEQMVIAGLSAFTGDWITATPFDYSVLYRYGVRFNWLRCHDLTLLHSRFDIELPHTLEFIASMWTERPFWKYLNHSDPYRYNCLDCVGEYEAFKKLYMHCMMHAKGVLKCYESDRKLEKVAVEFMLNGLPANPIAFSAEKAYYEIARKELENEVVASFTPATREEDNGGDVSGCTKHPRYSGRGPVNLRKGEVSPCSDCGLMREQYLSKQPLNLRSRTQLARKLRKEGMHVGASLDKGKVAALAKKYADPRLMRLLEFKRRDTICTRYFAKLPVTRATGRIHSTYSMHAAKHRWASNGPNAQQFMRPEE